MWCRGTVGEWYDIVRWENHGRVAEWDDIHVHVVWWNSGHVSGQPNRKQWHMCNIYSVMEQLLSGMIIAHLPVVVH